MTLNMKETIKNLAKAFVGESQARNRYTFYAKEAKKEGYTEGFVHGYISGLENCNDSFLKHLEGKE